MMFLMLVCVPPGLKLDPEEALRIGPDVEHWVREMDARRLRREGHELARVNEARTVRVRAGEVVVADGPFAETKEAIAGFDILECDDMAQAIEMAAKHPVARFGALELRPFAQG